MRSQSRKLPGLAHAAIVAVLCLIGLLAKATSAQDPSRALVPGPDTLALPSAPNQQGFEVPKIDNPALQPNSSVVGPPPESTIIPAAGTDADDPEKAALAFLEQNQMHAESQLNSLKAEEAKLQARLRKVEAGIKRWETLVGALKQSNGGAPVVVPGGVAGWKQAPPNGIETPERLDPISPEPSPQPVPARK